MRQTLTDKTARRFEKTLNIVEGPSNYDKNTAGDFFTHLAASQLGSFSQVAKKKNMKPPPTMDQTYMFRGFFMVNTVT